MNREILFRGKRVDNGKWVYGYYMVHDKLSYIVVDGTQFYEVIPETVGQFTGITDKNDTKIFERDCLGHKYNVVEMIDGCYVVAGDRPLNTMNKYFEIIGNIHEEV